MIQQLRPSYFLCFQTFPNGNYIRYIYACVRPVIFNPDDGKQPKTFGLNFLILTFLAWYIRYIADNVALLGDVKQFECTVTYSIDQTMYTFIQPNKN